MCTPTIVRGSQYDIFDDNNNQNGMEMGVGDGIVPKLGKTDFRQSRNLSRGLSSENRLYHGSHGSHGSYTHSCISPSIPSSQMLDDLFKWVWGIVYKVLCCGFFNEIEQWSYAIIRTCINLAICKSTMV